ncbi:LPS translocon maturation chaperone LptM [Guyparkeria hydrothermalis]|uniref:LPS translocon maturation chaperone LptM n=1 Tax=Guyparkeria hydrothermalis TaxID=923 RepID=UPI003D9C69DF
MSRLLPIPTLSRQLGAGLLLATLCLTGCGQKGPLYLPDEQPADKPAETDTSPTTTEQD